MASNVQLVRSLYEAWNSGDVEAAFARKAPGVVWIQPPDNPDGSERQGEEGVLASMTEWTAPFDEYGFEVVQAEEVGEQVLVGLKQWGRGRSSGAAVESEVWHLWTIRDGLGVRMQMFHSRPDALAQAPRPSNLHRHLT